MWGPLLFIREAGGLVSKPRQEICPCFHLTEEHIVSAIRRSKSLTLRKLQKHSPAGTACMSCRPAVIRLLKRKRA